jgi:3D (Asp-Asp-Asp) domain-containing protein
MKRTIYAIPFIIALSFIVGLHNSKATLRSTNVTQINTSVVTNPPQTERQIPLWRTVQMRVTAYCPCEKCCGKYADGFTASGHKIKLNETFVAADKQYPFGTEMIVPGYNNDQPVKVLDRGSAIQDDRLDVFFPSHQQALNWGAKYLPVKILTK